MKSEEIINIIISIDPSTEFLFEIISNIEELKINLITIEPSDGSYKESIVKISEIPEHSNIIFLGHGTSTILYGGESESFEKKEIISLRTMNVFKNQNIFLLACDSALLLKSSFRLSQIKKSIGFGSLPTSIEEIENDKKLSKIGITDEIIESYKKEIVNIVSSAFNYTYQNNVYDFTTLKDFIDLLLLIKMNKAILEDNNPLLADLLYKMKNEMVIY